MVGLQGHWGKRFGSTVLDDFSLRRACRATRESALEECLIVFVFRGGCCVDSFFLGCRATGDSVLEVFFWMAFGNAEVVSPLCAPR